MSPGRETPERSRRKGIDMAESVRDRVIRIIAEQAVLEGTFRIPDAVRQPIHAILEREDLLDDISVTRAGYVELMKRQQQAR